MGQTLQWLGAARGSQHAAPAALCLLSLVGKLLSQHMLPSKTLQSWEARCSTLGWIASKNGLILAEGAAIQGSCSSTCPCV